MNIKSIANRLVQALYVVCVFLIWGAGNPTMAKEISVVNSVAGQDKDKVLIIVSSDRHGFWLPEVLEPYQLLVQAGYQITIASPKGGQGKASGEFRLSNVQRQWFKQSKLKLQLKRSIPLAEVNPQSYAAVYFAGGAGPMFDLPDNALAQQITRDIYEAGGIVAADCHGPAALINIMLSNGKRLISGKKITAKANSEEGSWARNNYPFLLEDKIKELGGRYLASGKNQQHVVVDGRLITGQNPASAIPMAERLIEQLSRQGF
ncbi:type 1 glutamine amidotransferase domain-containing protein [Thalassomonas actiniarum]|uniref:Type 1 glutamine amidotransferase domain-containing protein n=1 Tax=Thalassomonas actiniarum TaxID=485447 RepID=A0AAE9YUN5_9GAMM|nr:type 1 glutamine amidotransferase domain-containing protein [Thalassomonas actiniarum]WDD99812.1 type 1 glutamine amidotransferase domain-containing protein [Thalassomonas actiniarum]